ncbi:TPA: elongation factor G [Candidatus Poribacteria bacterium]|nr:elongation factor G [Candidatus Poribacteria bacterium]
MKEYRTEQIRNVALIGNAGSGKTSLIDAILFDAGVVDRLGRVDAGNSFVDCDPEEINRKTTLSLKICIAEWEGCKLNILDTPGYEDFYGDLASALRVVDSALVVIDAVTGVGGGTEKSWMMADKYGLPRAILINKLDAEQADFDGIIDQIQRELGARLMPIHIPIGKGSSFSGIVDIISMKAYKFEGDGSDKFEEVDIPEELSSRAEELRESLIEAAAEGEDELTEKYLEGEELTPDEIARGLKASIREGIVVPVMCTSAYQNISVPFILDFIVKSLPSPVESKPIESREPSPDAPLAALVFKTTSDPYIGKISYIRVFSGVLTADSQIFNSSKETGERVTKLYHLNGKNQIETPRITAGDLGIAVKLQSASTGDTLCAPEARIVLPGIEFPKPVLSLAISAKSQSDDDKLSTILTSIAEEDPTFQVQRDQEMKQVIVSGLGDVHLNVTLERIKRRYNIEATTTTPKVPYRETIRKSVEGIHARYKKQTGGRGQFADVVIKMEPLPRGEYFEFVDEIFGGAIPRNFIPAVEKGIRNSMQSGVLAGFPVVDIKVTLYDGKFHPVDSSDLAFQIAASMAFKEAMQKADPVLLEPIMNVEVTVPEEHMGDVLADLNSRRGRVLGVDQKGKYQVIKAQVPMAEMFRYALDLRSMTSARGWFTMEFSHYEEVPYDIAQKIIATAQAEKED